MNEHERVDEQRGHDHEFDNTEEEQASTTHSQVRERNAIDKLARLGARHASGELAVDGAQSALHDITRHLRKSRTASESVSQSREEAPAAARVNARLRARR
jgi:hypothetical protein